MCSPIETNPQARRLTSLGMLCLALSAGSQSLNFTFGFGPNPLETPEVAAARMARTAEMQKNLAVTKRFQVTSRSRQGGSGVFDNSEDE